MFELTSQPIDSAALRRHFERPDAGALCVFEGWVRNHHGGRPVAFLEYEAAEDFCRVEAGRLLAEVRSRFEVHDVIVVHRVGRLKIGDIAVWIGVCSSHRDAAFGACRAIIEELKVRLPVWKKEHYDSGETSWIGSG